MRAVGLLADGTRCSTELQAACHKPDTVAGKLMNWSNYVCNNGSIWFRKLWFDMICRKGFRFDEWLHNLGGSTIIERQEIREMDADGPATVTPHVELLPFVRPAAHAVLISFSWRSCIHFEPIWYHILGICCSMEIHDPWSMSILPARLHACHKELWP